MICRKMIFIQRLSWFQFRLCYTDKTKPVSDLIVFKWRAYHVGALRGKDVVLNKILQLQAPQHTQSLIPILHTEIFALVNCHRQQNQITNKIISIKFKLYPVIFENIKI